MTTNRIVILISPVFVGLAGWIVQLAARYMPGHPHLNQSSLRDLFIAGALFAAAHVAQWVHGSQKTPPKTLAGDVTERPEASRTPDAPETPV